MMTPSTSTPANSVSFPAAPILGGSFARRAILRALAPLPRGRLRFELPEGRSIHFGAPAAADQPLAQIRVRRESFFRRCLLAGDIGFAEAFIDGDWETPDLTAVIAWFILNHDLTPTLSGAARARGQSWLLNRLRFAHRLSHALRPNSRAIAKRNISAHYDLSNEFFALFLDPSMMYSSAKWARPEQTLAEAQTEKNEALCRLLRLRPDNHVLEIGTGWGGWALHAAQTHGCRVTSVTISREQFDFARARVVAAGLTDRIDVQFRDYREVQGTYDKVVSIEMMEALGHRYQPQFADVVSRVLKRDGLLALQFITCPDARYEEMRRGVDFIQKHIFPGSLLLSLNRVNDLLARRGGFVLHQVDDLGHDYARTLREWQARFRSHLPEVRALGFDERFIRKWSYYLSYSEAAFARRHISVVHTLHTRANNGSI